MFSFWGLALFARFLLDFSLEASAFWCFSTVTISICVLCEPLIEKLFGYVEQPERKSMEHSAAPVPDNNHIFLN